MTYTMSAHLSRQIHASLSSIRQGRTQSQQEKSQSHPRAAPSSMSSTKTSLDEGDRRRSRSSLSSTGSRGQ